MSYLRTIFWALPPLCWVSVFIVETPPAFGMPRWLHALVILSFWLMVASKLHKLHKIEALAESAALKRRAA